MTLSRTKTSRPLGQNAGRSGGRTLLRYAPLASAISAILAGVPVAYAADAEGGLDEIVVTAQKKTENMQNVPISISVFDATKLDQLHVENLDDYVRYSPGIAYVRGEGQGGNGQPGSSHIYMRGVVSGGTNHSGSQPSVGSYLDEQPVTTIDGTVDIHIYDIQRIEVLEGPQGTLYGASSQAGTVRIITNKPDPSKFEAGYQLGGNHVQHGGFGYEADGFVNLPLSPIAAVRLVGWKEHDGGFIDNVAGTNASAGIIDGIRTFPTWDTFNGGTGSNGGTADLGKGSISNAAYVKNNYNQVNTEGGRAALKVNLGEDWTVTPTVMGQRVTSEGFFGYDPAVGDLEVVHFGPESSDDSWDQSALTVEGKVSDFDIVYAGAFMKRNVHSIADYSDYSYFYDKVDGSGASWKGSNGQPIMPQELVVENSAFEKFSHEVRVSTPQDLPVRGTAGVFVQRQLHRISEDYVMPGYDFANPLGGNANGFDPFYSIPGHPNTIWLTDETRVDRDKAVFAQVTWDITSHWELSGGERYFKSDNTLEGFYGYSLNFSPSGSGMSKCFAPTVVVGAPCQNLGNRATDKGHVPKVNLTYKIDKDKMVYATWSQGFRPGGVNRTAQPGIGPYQADFLTNYEVGWKTQWFDHHLRWNGAIFQEDWKNFQFSFLGLNSVTIIENAGNARIRGLESELEWAATSNLTLTSGVTFLDTRLRNNYCGENDASGQAATSDPCPAGEGGPVPYTPLAPAGANLPVSPKFKGNLIARYALNPIMDWNPNVQAAFVYQTQVAPALKTQDAQLIGMEPAYGMVDLTAGIERNGMNIELIIDNLTDKRAQLSRFEQCTVAVCTQPYAIPAQPRTVGVKFGQKF
jgi:outer membrane receptor protein involved in Fe transport